MGIVKVQFNPSTLEVIYKAATNEVQVVETSIDSVCEHCIDMQPAWLCVSFEEFVNCNCTQMTESSWWKAGGFATNLNDFTFKVMHSAGCVYDTNYTGKTYGTVYRYTDDGCENLSQTINYDALRITITLTETGADIEVRFGIVADPGPPYEWYIFSGSLTYIGDDACGDTNQHANNDIIGCSDYPDTPTTFYPCGSSGVANIAVP